MKKPLIIIFILTLLFLIGCENVNYENIDNFNDCEQDEDCILVQADFCGRATSINKKYAVEWGKYLAKEKKENEGEIFCKQTLPLDYFEAVCENNKCIAKQVKSGVD